MENSTWKAHHQLLDKQSLPPAHTLSWCLRFIKEESLNMGNRAPFAIDLGCGNGIDTLALLKDDWRVLAIDKVQEALENLKYNINPLFQNNLKTDCISFEELSHLPTCELLNATFSLPFCSPEHFDNLWKLIESSIRDKGFFCGHFFGFQDSWSTRPEMIFHEQKQISLLFSNFTILVFEEVNKIGKTLSGNEKNWHVFHIVAQKNK